MASANDSAGRAMYKNVVMVNKPMYQDYYNENSMYTGERAFLNDLTPIDQLIWALASPLTEAEKNPPEITQKTYNEALAWETKTFTGATYDKTVQEFNNYAMEYKFGDGLPLVLPTQALVDEMLAGTTRDKDEVLGLMKMRGGIITVEKIAINAVMAGAKPEYLPVLIAAMESYANGWEYDKAWYHNMSTGAFSIGIVLVLNGPLAKELNLANDRGYAGAGHEANNLIGRAFRMCIRNIGGNMTPEVDTQNRLGRLNDHTLMVFSEQEDKLPSGWKPHHVMMGFAAEESTVSMLGIWSAPFWFGSEDQANNWTPQSVMTNTRSNVTTVPNFQLIPPGVASVLADPALAGAYYMPTKEAVKEWWATHNTSGGTQTRNAGMYNVSHPIVVGGNPNYVASLCGFDGVNGFNLYNTLCYTTQLISGATLTSAGRGATVPSTPENFIVKYSEDGTSATLTWDAPLSDGGNAIIGYQVNAIHGGNRKLSPWGGHVAALGPATNSDTGFPNLMTYNATGVPDLIEGGAAARSFTFNGLVPGEQYFFKVRAVNSVVNSAEYVTAAAGINYARGSGRGAWAMCSAEKVSVESLKIDAPAMLTVTRNSTVPLVLITNNNAALDGIVWTSADNSYATVDGSGNVNVLNKTGIVVITAKDSSTGISDSIVLRIT
jgi:hypothetical protein